MSRLFPILLMTLVSLLPLASSAEELPGAQAPLITAREVADFRARHEAGWQRNTDGDASRLFHSSQEWPEIRARIRALDGVPGQWRDLAVRTADAIIARPLPVYRPPEEFVDEKNTILQAREELWQRDVGNNIAFLAFMARLDEDNPAYKAYLRDLVLAAMKFDSWGHGIWENIDLAAAHIIRGVAMTWDWHRDIFNEEQQTLIRTTLTRRGPTLLSGLYGEKFWGNQYRQNHNHICMAALGLAGLAFLDDLPDAGDWLAAALINYERVLQAMNADGSTEEGLGYWSYGMNFILQFIEGTRRVTGSDALYAAPFLGNTATYRLASSTPGFHGVLLWGDATGRDYYGPQHILLRLASQYRDEGAQFLAESLPFAPRGGGPTANSNDVLAFALLWHDASVGRRPPARLDHHLPDWEVLTSRSGWGREDYLFSLKSGLNNLHHSHLDAGSIALNFGGTWLLTAPGYGASGAPGFWERLGRRWTFFSNATESHSTLLVNGRNQRFDAKAGATVTRLVSAPRTLLAGTDLTQAYDGVRSATRRVLHRRGDYIVVLDDLASASGDIDVEWLAQMPPRALLRDGAIVATADSTASLRIELPGAPAFAERKHTVPHYNLRPVSWNPEGKLKTLASAKRGPQVRFAALLRPFFPGQPEETWQTEFQEESEKSVFRIAAPRWRETVETFSAPDRQGRVGDAQAGGIANLLAVRRDAAGKPDSLVGAGVRELNSPALSLSTEQAVDVALERDADGAWSFSLATEFRGDLRLHAPFGLTDARGRAINAGTGAHLPAGAYALRPVSAP